jgi:hypothetical protein
VDGGIDGGGEGDNGGKVDDLATGGHVANGLDIDPRSFRQDGYRAVRHVI